MELTTCILLATLLSSCGCSGDVSVMLPRVSYSVSVVSAKFSVEEARPSPGREDDEAVIASSAPHQEPLPTSEMTSHGRQMGEESTRQDLLFSEGRISGEGSAQIRDQTGYDGGTSATPEATSELPFPIGEGEFDDSDRDEADALLSLVAAATPASALPPPIDVQDRESLEGHKASMAWTIGAALGAAVFVVSALVGMSLFVYNERTGTRPRLLDANDSSSESGVSRQESINSISRISQPGSSQRQPQRDYAEETFHLDDSFLFSLEHVENPVSNWRSVRGTKK